MQQVRLWAITPGRGTIESPEQLNRDHPSLVVAEAIDESIDRIVRYLAELGVPINVATVQHSQDADGRELPAQVYLVEPESPSADPSPASRISGTSTVNSLQAEADKNGIGELYRRIRSGVRGGLFIADPYTNSVAYCYRRKAADGGGVRMVMLVRPYPADRNGVGFTIHATRFETLMGIPLDDLLSWLPENAEASEASGIGWVGSSAEERKSARGVSGTFHTAEEVDKFITSLRGRVL